MTLPKNKSIVTLSKYECGETGEPPTRGRTGGRSFDVLYAWKRSHREGGGRAFDGMGFRCHNPISSKADYLPLIFYLQKNRRDRHAKAEPQGEGLKPVEVWLRGLPYEGLSGAKRKTYSQKGRGGTKWARAVKHAGVFCRILNTTQNPRVYERSAILSGVN